MDEAIKKQDEHSSHLVLWEHFIDIVDQHITLLNNYRIDVLSEYRCLPLFYWLPKLHKNPYGTRFIAASHKCTTKPLSKLLTSCLKGITVHYKQYCNGIFVGLELTVFWIIDNSQLVLSTLNQINYFSMARHFDSYEAFRIQHSNKL